MFEQAVLSNGPAAKRVWTTSVGLMGQAVAVGSVVLLSVISPQTLPIATILTRLETPGPPPAPQPPGPVVKPHGPITHVLPVHPGVLVIPTHVPEHPQIIEDLVAVNAVPGSPGGGGVQGGSGAGVQGGSILDQILRTVPPVPRPVETVRAANVKAEPAAPPRIVRISQLRPAQLIRKVEPIYPQIALKAHVQGAVQIEAIVAVDGRMRDLRVVSGHPLLINAAVEAVRQWIYEPTVLNGEKVEVSAPITVNFKLGN